MARSIESMLRGVARKLLLTRAIEAAAVGATAGLACGAALTGAWLLAGPMRTWALLLALLPAAAGALLVAGSLPGPVGQIGLFCERRLGMGSTLRLAVGAVCLALGVVGIGLVVLGRQSLVPHRWLAGVAAGTGAIVAAATVIVRGVSLREAAIYLDLRGQLGERLTTALELSQASHDFSQAVTRQAMDTIARHRPDRLGFWRRTRLTPGALALAALACAGLALLTPLQAPGEQQRRRWQQVRQELAQDAAEQIQQIRTEPMQTPSPQLERTLEDWEELVDDVQWGRAEPAEAMGRYSRIQDEIRRALERDDALSSAIEQLRENELTRGLAESGSAGAEEPGAGAGSDGEQGSSSQAASRDAAEALGARMASGAMSDAQRQQMGDTLGRAADAAGGDPRLSEALRRAARAVDEANAEAFERAMAQAGEAMDDTRNQGAGAARDELTDAMNRIEQQKDRIAEGMGGGQGLAGDQQFAGGQDGQGGQGGQNGQGGHGQQGAGAGGSGISEQDIEQAIARAEGQGSSGGQGAGQQGAGGQGGAGGPQGSGGQGSGQQGAGGQGAGGSGGQGAGGQGSGGQGSGGQGQGGQGAGGSGSTNMNNPSGAGSHYEGDAFNEREWTQVYDPQSIETQGPTIRPDGVVDPNGDPAASATFYAPGTTGESYVPYEDAWGAARNRAEEAVGRQRIPARLRTLVRDYFNDEPPQQQP